MNELQHVEELEQVFDRSHRHPVLLFKHSETCPTSARAHEEYRSFLEERDVDAETIVVQRARPVSNLVEERTGVRHESPQALLLSDGEVAWHASHDAITAEALEREFERLAD